MNSDRYDSSSNSFDPQAFGRLMATLEHTAEITKEHHRAIGRLSDAFIEQHAEATEARRHRKRIEEAMDSHVRSCERWMKYLTLAVAILAVATLGGDDLRGGLFKLIGVIL